MFHKLRTFLVLLVTLLAWGLVEQASAAFTLTADANANVSAGRFTGQVNKSIMPGPGSLAVTIGAAASDSIPRDPSPGFHEYVGILTGSGSARYGSLAGRAHAEASSRPAGGNDPYGAGGQVILQLGFFDTAEVVSSTLLAGTPVTLTFIMTLDAAAVHFADGPFTPGRIGSSARNEARILDIEANVSTPPLSPFTFINSRGEGVGLRTFQFDTAVGHHLEIDVDMFISAGAIIDPYSPPFPPPPPPLPASQGSADVIADNTAHFFYQTSSDVQLVAESEQDYALAPLLGDYDTNGKVDAADYVLWRNGLGTAYTQNHYNIWRANFGRTAGSGSTAGLPNRGDAAVPEPATLVLLVLAAVGASTRRR